MAIAMRAFDPVAGGGDSNTVAATSRLPLPPKSSGYAPRTPPVFFGTPTRL
jgi:hypothetical protein